MGGHLLKHMLWLVVLLLFGISNMKCEENTTEWSEPEINVNNRTDVIKVETNTSLSGWPKLKVYFHEVSNLSQPRFLSVLNSLFRVFRFFFRHLYEAYHWFHPEVKMATCMFRFARKQYPELKEHLTINNFMKFSRKIFIDFYNYISDLLNDEQSNEWLDRTRIAAKVSELTEEMHYMPLKNTSSPLNYREYVSQPSGQVPPHERYMNVMAIRRMDSQPRMMGESNRQFRQSREHSYEQKDQQFSVMYVGPRQLTSTSTVPPPESPPTEDSEETIEDLFDFDSVLYESLGIQRKQGKEWTPVYCVKEYTVSFFKRMVLDLLLA